MIDGRVYVREQLYRLAMRVLHRMRRVCSVVLLVASFLVIFLGVDPLFAVLVYCDLHLDIFAITLATCRRAISKSDAMNADQAQSTGGWKVTYRKHF